MRCNQNYISFENLVEIAKKILRNNININMEFMNIATNDGK